MYGQNMKTLVSVIIPIYNMEKHLGECLDSVLRQCTDECEVVMVNDGSTDCSVSICNDYIQRYQVKTKLINQENKGALKSRENGIKESTGEYVLFLDADDMFLDNALSTILEAVKGKKPDMILFNATSDLETLRPRYVMPLEHGHLYSGDDRYEVFKLLCCSDVLNNLWTKCIRKDLFQRLTVIEAGQRITNGEDLFQILELADNAGSILYLDRILYYYRVLSGSMARNYNPLYYSSEKTVCEKRLDYAEKWGKGDELTSGTRMQICRIMRVVAMLLLVSDMPWEEVRKEMKALRGDSFFKTYYLDAHEERDKRDMLLKAPFFVMYVGRLFLKKKRMA